MTYSKALLFVMLSFIGGVFVSSFISVPQLIIYEVIVLGILYSFFKHKLILVFGICLLFLGLGMIRAGSVEPQVSSSTQHLSRFQQTIDENLSPPQSGILSAILLGNKDEISKEFKEKLNTTGIRHITAISGMHIVILSSILLWLGMVLGLKRSQAFYPAIIILWLFIFAIGFPPSAIRAGVMGSMFLLAEKLGRQKTADRALFLTAAVMLAINPSLLRYSIGFQLSFMATLGIIYLMPVLQKWINRLLKISSISSLLAMSFSAQIFVLPLLVYYFGQVSIVSPITNLLVVPILPFLMSIGFLFVILGTIWQPLSFLLLFPVWLMLSYVTKITELFSSLSFSVINLQIHWLWLPIIYSLLSVIVWRIKKGQETTFLP